MTSLASYVERMRPGQEQIYYVLASSREAAEASPNTEYFRSREIEVLYFTDPVDIFTVPHLGKFRDHEFVSVEKADIEEMEPSDHDELSAFARDNLLKELRLHLKGKVEDVRVSRRLVDSVATLVAGDHGLDAQTERVLKMIDDNFQGGSRVLEINPNHELIVNLSRLIGQGRKEPFREAATQIYEAALLLDGNLSNPADFVRRMTSYMVDATRTESENGPQSNDPSD